jgi:hypothetical protein
LQSEQNGSSCGAMIMETGVNKQSYAARLEYYHLRA